MKLEKADLPKKSLPIFFILSKNELNFGHAIFFSRPQFTYLERWFRGSECTTTLSEDQVQFSAPTQDNLQLPVTPAPGIRCFFWPLRAPAYMCTYSHKNRQIHIIKKN